MNNFENQFDIIVKKHQDIEKSLSNQDNLDSNKVIKLNKEYAELTPLTEKIIDYKKCLYESLISIKRSGACGIFCYGALDIAKKIKK